MGIAAFGFDLTRVYVAQTRMQSALDSAAIAAASAFGREEAEVRRVAQNYFDRNYGDGSWLPAATLNVELTDNTLAISADAQFETSFMRVVGLDTFDISAATEAIAEPSGLEVVLVLDATRSMLESTSGTTRLESLKSAATSLVDILTANATDPDLIRIGIVPYNASVNIGTGNAGFVDGVTAANFPGTDWSGCVMARANDGDVTDEYTPGGTAARGRWQAYRWPAEPNQLTPGGAASAVCDNPARAGSTTAYASVIDRFSPTGGYPGITAGPNRSCPQPIEPLTSNHQTIRDRISNLDIVEGGGTMSALGASWGWRVLSPNEPFAEGEDYENDRWRKIMIIMTDGEQNLSQNANDLGQSCSTASGVSGNLWQHDPRDFGASGSTLTNGPQEHWTAYGYPMATARFGSNNYDTVITALENRLRTVCNNIKNEVHNDRPAISIYSLTFGDNIDLAARNLVRSCATNNDNYFHAPTGVALEESFRDIAFDILNARITR